MSNGPPNGGNPETCDSFPEGSVISAIGPNGKMGQEQVRRKSLRIS
jgi:hypothetical protein